MRYGPKVLRLEALTSKDIRQIAGVTMDIARSLSSGTKEAIRSDLPTTGVVAEATNGFVQAKRQSKPIRWKSSRCVRGLSLRLTGWPKSLLRIQIRTPPREASAGSNCAQCGRIDSFDLI